MCRQFDGSSLTQSGLQMAHYLNENRDSNAFNLLQIERLVNRPSDTKQFIRMCYRLFKTVHKEIFAENLKLFPVQKKLDSDSFGELVEILVAKKN